MVTSNLVWQNILGMSTRAYMTQRTKFKLKILQNLLPRTRK